jgi:hypothetical protein
MMHGPERRPKSAPRPDVECRSKDEKTTRLSAIEADYRAGVISIRAIGFKYGVSEAAIRKWAKNAVDARGNPAPWSRDLKPLVDARVAEILAADPGKSPAHVRAAVRTPHARAEIVRALHTEHGDAEAVEVTSRAVVQVVQGHRLSISARLQTVNNIVTLLGIAAECRDLLQEVIHEETAGDRNGKRRASMLKAISLESHAGAVKDLAAAMEKLVALDRQAFGLADGDAPTQSPGPFEPAPKATYEVFDGILRRARERIKAAADAECAPVLDRSQRGL